MSGDEIVIIAVTAMIAGVVSSIGSTLLTVAALRVHIEYLRQADAKHDAAISRAHERIDEINQNGCAHQQGVRSHG